MKKRVLVTGSSRGIGFSCAKTFSDNGYEVFLNAGHDKERFDASLRELNTRGFFCDVSDRGKLLEMFEEIGEIDVLINCAGVSYVGLLTDMGECDIKTVLDTNLLGVINCCQLAVPAMVRKNFGRIINISSIWGNVGASCEAVYSAAKGGVNAFSKALGKELAPSGITVNAVACGVIDTDMNSIFTEDELQDLYSRIPAQRPGTPQEVADLCLFLASEKAGYINGQVITIDGGFA